MREQLFFTSCFSITGKITSDCGELSCLFRITKGMDMFLFFPFFCLSLWFNLSVCCFTQERHRTKQLLAAQEILFPGLYHSLLTAMKPLMARYRVGQESSKMKEGNYEDFLWHEKMGPVQREILYRRSCSSDWLRGRRAFYLTITERSKILSIYPIFFSKVQITIKTPKTGGMFQLFYLNVANK